MDGRRRGGTLDGGPGVCVGVGGDVGLSDGIGLNVVAGGPARVQPGSLNLAPQHANALVVDAGRRPDLAPSPCSPRQTSPKPSPSHSWADTFSAQALTIIHFIFYAFPVTCMSSRLPSSNWLATLPNSVTSPLVRVAVLK